MKKCNKLFVLMMCIIITLFTCVTTTFASEQMYTYEIEFSMTSGSQSYTLITYYKNVAFVVESERTYLSYCENGSVGHIRREDEKVISFIDNNQPSSIIFSLSPKNTYLDVNSISGVSLYSSEEEFIKACSDIEDESPTSPSNPSEGIENDEFVIVFFENEFVYYVSIGFVFAFAITFLIVLVCYAFRCLLEIVKNN